jgi:hypothetical protein
MDNMILCCKIKTSLLRIFLYLIASHAVGHYYSVKDYSKGGSLFPFLNLLLCSLQYESDEQEKSAYQEYDSDSDVPEELKQDYVDEQTGDAPVKRCLFLLCMFFFFFFF